MKIHCIDSQSALSINREDVERLVSSFLSWKSIQTDEVTVHFVSKDEISRLHLEFFQDPSPTDCISFPIDPPGETGHDLAILGEVFVCPEVAIEYAAANSGCPYKETTLYIIHALLHLIGYDDLTESDAKIMRVEENSAMLFLEKNKEVLHA